LKRQNKPHPDAVVQPKDADAFMMFVSDWQDKLNLHDWRIHRSARKPARSDMAAVVKRDLGARLASYVIGEDFGSITVTGQSIEEIALHEVLHVFLYEMIERAKEFNGAASGEPLESAEHRVINTLVSLLVKRA